LLVQDARARWALLLAGAFGAYSLGANNIANVMGVFLLSVALQDLHISAWLRPESNPAVVSACRSHYSRWRFHTRLFFLFASQGLAI